MRGPPSVSLKLILAFAVLEVAHFTSRPSAMKTESSTIIESLIARPAGSRMARRPHI